MTINRNNRVYLAPTTWSVVSSFVQTRWEVLTVDFDPDPPLTGSIPSLALWRKCHSWKESGVRHDKRPAFSLAISRANPELVCSTTFLTHRGPDSSDCLDGDCGDVFDDDFAVLFAGYHISLSHSNSPRPYLRGSKGSSMLLLVGLLKVPFPWNLPSTR